MEKSFPFYNGNVEYPRTSGARFSSIISHSRTHRPYLADPGLIKAVNVSLVLGRPLLLTGEPGTGKTQLAFSLGDHLGYKVRKFEAKSTSTARELFYSYDLLGRLHATQLQQDKDGGKIDARDYISYNALGLAIIRSHNYHDIKDRLPRGFPPWSHGVRSVVLIDEIDKAPRDFPNDLLNELEEMYFRIPEIGLLNEGISAPEDMRPVMVITSNSEKGLPDAFLRRCVYYDVPFPDDHERLNEIVLAHNASYATPNKPWLSDAIHFFLTLRRLKPRLEKRPSTAELLDWLAYLDWKAPAQSLRHRKDLLIESGAILFKTVTDLGRAETIIAKWLEDGGARV